MQDSLLVTLESHRRFGNDTDRLRPGSLRWLADPHQTAGP